MKEEYLKKIFIVFMIVLVLIGIYISVSSAQKESIISSKLVSKNKEIIISNDIRVGIIELDNINPILSKNKNVQDISRLIFEPLFTLTTDYKLEGVLAKECSKIENRTYIIKLNENITWHDGNKFDSLDVIFTINILKKLKEESIYYHNVKDIIQVQKIDEYTIKIITNKEISYFEYNLIFPIISSKYFNEENIKTESKNIKPVGTGMFYISDVNNDAILLKNNLTRELKIETITLKIYKSLSNLLEGFKKEEIDAFTTSNINIEEYLKNTSYNKVQYANRNYEYIALNCENKILSNKEVRQALSYGIDKKELLKSVYSDKYIQSNFPLDFGNYVYDKNSEVIEYDANLAKNILLESGWKYSNGSWIKSNNLKIELNMVVNKNNLNSIKIANNIKEQLNKIGILINLNEVSKQEYNNCLKNKEYDLILLNDTYSYSPSLEEYLGEENSANYKNEEIEKLLKDAELSFSENEIKQKYSNIINIFNQEVPYICLNFNINTFVYSNNLKGRINPNSYNIFYGIENWYREYEK